MLRSPADGITLDPSPAGLVFIAGAISNSAAAIPPQTVQVLAGSSVSIPYQGVSQHGGRRGVAVGQPGNRFHFVGVTGTVGCIRESRRACGRRLPRRSQLRVFRLGDSHLRQRDFDCAGISEYRIGGETLADFHFHRACLRTDKTGSHPDGASRQFRPERRTACTALAFPCE